MIKAHIQSKIWNHDKPVKCIAYIDHTHTSILYNSLSAALNIPSRKLALDIRSLHSAPKAWSISCDTDHISSFKDICFNWLKLFETPILDVDLPYVSWFCPLCFMAFSHFDDSDVQVLLDFAGRAKLVDFGCCKKAGSPTPKRFAGGSSKSGISPVLFTPILWCVFSRKMLGGGDPGQHLGGNAGVPGTGGEKRMGDLSGEIMMVYGNRKWWFNGHLIGISWNVSGNLIFFHGKYKMMVSPSLKSLKWWFFMKGDNHEISWLVVFHGNFTGDLMAYIYRRMYIYIEREIYREMTKYTYLYILMLEFPIFHFFDLAQNM